MNGKMITAFVLILIAAMLTACGNSSDTAVQPLLGLEWYTDYEAAKTDMEDYKLLQERESSAQDAQKMQDYAGVSLYDTACDLTLCFTDSGLIGLNYHDAARSRNYREWFAALEGSYGLPTEQGSGMASWYGNPLGKNTAIYLFNLQEGVQVSFYATADSPDQSYGKQKRAQIPTPELRTPVMPVAEESAPVTEIAPDAAETTAPVSAGQYRAIIRDVPTNHPAENQFVIVTDDAGAAVTDPAGVTVTTAVTVTGTAAETAVQSSSTSKYDGDESETVTTTAAAQESALSAEERAFLQNGLTFYGTPESARRRMSGYVQRYEYRTAEPGQPWELIMEYADVPYFGKACDCVLCFTSLGLVGVNYYDTDARRYDGWVTQLTEIYGAPDDLQRGYAVWNGDPVGAGTMIYAFVIDDGVQISFFADDTGSEAA